MYLKRFAVPSVLLLFITGMSLQLDAQSTLTSKRKAGIKSSRPGSAAKNEKRGVDAEVQVISRAMNLLVGNQLISKRLELADYQVDDLRRAKYDFHREMGKLAKEMKGKTQGERQKLVRTKFEGMQQKVEEILLPHQLDRLKQVAYQSMALNSDGSLNLGNLVANKVIQRELGIDSSTIKEIRKRVGEERKRLEEEIAKLKAESQQRILSTLSSSQKRKMEKLIGDPFDFEGYRVTRSGRLQKADSDH